MIYLLVWLLLGSMSLNYLWIQNHKATLKEISKMDRKGKVKVKNKHYIKGLLMAIIAGPITLPLKLYIDNSVEKAKLEALRRKRGMAQVVKK